MSSTSILAAFEGPSLDEFFPKAIFFEGTPFEINRVIMVRLIAVVVLALLLVLFAKRAKLVPKRAQAAMEMLLEVPGKMIAESVFGEETAKRYAPFIATIFFTVLFMNITGIIPGLQIAGTSIIGMPLLLAVIAYVAFIFHGIRVQGGLHFFKSQLFPAGIPWPAYFIVTPIEFLSTFIVRPVTLTARLLGNMMAGHLLLALIFLGTHFFFFEMQGSGFIFGGVTVIGGLIFTVFEAFVAVLQAYIFSVLTAVYIQLSISNH